MQSVKTVIVGQGLAGTTLGWQLELRQHDFMIIDPVEAVTCSRIAAGLMTPVTGQRIVPSSRWNRCWPVARSFYRSVERVTQRRFFQNRVMLRLFLDEQEKQGFLDRFAGRNSEEVRYPAAGWPHAVPGIDSVGFEMPDAGQLNVARYLEVSREHWKAADRFLHAKVDINRDLEWNNDRLLLPRFGIATDRIVLCRGHCDSGVAELDLLKWDSAKGEILKVRIPGLEEDRVVHRGVWLVREHDDVFRIGATYDREQLNRKPTAAARTELAFRLSKWMNRSFEVLDQSAAVRPILEGRHPLAGIHPDEPRLACLNGLASKGALVAPWLAAELADSICRRKPVPRDIGFARWLAR